MEHPTTAPSRDDNDDVETCRSVAGESPLGSVDEETKATEPRHATPPTTRGRRSYGQGRVSAEHKRERNRATFRRFYQRKQETLRELREEVVALTDQYEQLKVSNQVTEPSSIVRLISMKDSLTAEHAALQHVVQDQLTTRRLLQRLVDDIDQSSTMPSLPPPVMDFDVPAVLEQAMYVLSELRLSPEAQNDAFGWHCQSQRQDDDHVAFRLAKEFPTTELSSAEATQRTWAFESTSTAAARTTAPLVRTTRHVLLASVHEATRIVFRQSVRDHHNTTDDDNQRGVRLPLSAKSVYAVAFVELASGGWAVVSCSVPNQAAYDPGDDHRLDVFQGDKTDLSVLLDGTVQSVEDEWIEELSWWRITPSNAGVQVTYAALAPVCLGLSPSACFMEVLHRVVEWEQVVLGGMPIDVAALDSIA